ncbi:hypothetical protein E2C01_072448 [Portunus trituberculatus]|uniref:Uncharacterized protein n=1 Tax=Portunus trituberculatus TaxID=210409 RepID=A0A5B7IAR6_PORTR|nr:hypothetical protein [Portunus trituberculatus]
MEKDKVIRLLVPKERLNEQKRLNNEVVSAMERLNKQKRVNNQVVSGMERLNDHSHQHSPTHALTSPPPRLPTPVYKFMEE